MRRLVVLPLVLGLTACGGPTEGDLADTCTKVAKAWPGNLYDDAATAAFADELDDILAAADAEPRKVFADVQAHTRRAAEAKGDNTAVITEGVEVAAALEDVNQACEKAGGPKVG